MRSVSNSGSLGVEFCCAYRKDEVSVLDTAKVFEDSFKTTVHSVVTDTKNSLDNGLENCCHSAYSSIEMVHCAGKPLSVVTTKDHMV